MFLISDWLVTSPSNLICREEIHIIQIVLQDISNKEQILTKLSRYFKPFHKGYQMIFKLDVQVW